MKFGKRHHFYHMTQCGKLFQHHTNLDQKDRLHETLEQSDSPDVSEWAKYVNKTIAALTPKLKGWE